MPTKQETLDKVATHLLKQNAKSEGPKQGDTGVVCWYRGPNGLKCAAGCCIPDEKYKPYMEGKKAAVLDPEIFDGHDIDLLADLQIIHDTSRIEHWRADLANLARNRGLEMPQC